MDTREEEQSTRDNSSVKAIPKIENQKTKPDPHYPAAVERAKEAARRLLQMGIIDAEGRRIGTELPSDMQEGLDYDLGSQLSVTRFDHL